MTNEAKSAAIARACGWKQVPNNGDWCPSMTHYWVSPKGEELPDCPGYFTNPAACIEACNALELNRSTDFLYGADQGVAKVWGRNTHGKVILGYGPSESTALAEALVQTPKVKKALESEADND